MVEDVAREETEAEVLVAEVAEGGGTAGVLGVEVADGGGGDVGGETGRDSLAILGAESGAGHGVDPDAAVLELAPEEGLGLGGGVHGEADVAWGPQFSFAAC